MPRAPKKTPLERALRSAAIQQMDDATKLLVLGPEEFLKRKTRNLKANIKRKVGGQILRGFGL